MNPIKDKNGITITNASQKILKESNRKSNKIWVDKGSEFYNSSMKSWLEKNDIEIYSADNEGKSVLLKDPLGPCKIKFILYMTSISKSVFIDKLDDRVNKYKYTYHSTTKMKSIDIKQNTYIQSSKEISDKSPKFKIGDNVKISKFNVFAKGYTPNWSEEVFIIKEVKNTVPWTYAIFGLIGDEIVGTFYEKELQKTIQKEFRVEKVIKGKGNKLYVK